MDPNESEDPSSLRRRARHLGDLASLLVVRGALPLSALKVVDLARLDKPRVAFLRRAVAGPLASKDRKKIFSAASASPALSAFRDGMALFLRHFVAKKDAAAAPAVEEAVEAMSAEGRSRNRL